MPISTSSNTLHDALRHLSATLDASVLHTRLLDAARQHTGATTAGFIQWDATGTGHSVLWKTGEADGVNPTSAQMDTWLARALPVVARMREAGASVDTNNDQGAVLCVPVMADSVWAGALYLEHAQAVAFDAGQRHAALVLATQAATTLALIEQHSALQTDYARVRASESELLMQRNLLRTVTESIPHRIYAKDWETRFIFGNQAVALGMGLQSPEELLGKTDFSFHPPEEAAIYRDEELAIMHTGKGMVDHEEQVHYTLSHEASWKLTTKVPLRDNAGQIVGIVGINHDITERKRIEQEVVQQNKELQEINAKLSDAHQHILQSEKLASIGQLGTGVARQLNHPMSYIASTLKVLDKYLRHVLELLALYEGAEPFISDNHTRQLIRDARQKANVPFIKDDAPLLMQDALDGIARARKTIQNLREFSQAEGDASWKVVSLPESLDAALNMVQNDIKNKAEIIRDYGNTPDVYCQPLQVNKVIVNLLTNAAEAIQGERGKITVRTGTDGDLVWIAVSDTGCGIDPEDLAHIFEPFYTAKSTGGGAGLGLSLAQGIMQHHQGHIEVQSTLGKGSTFRMVWPLTLARSVSPAGATQAATS